MNEQPNNETLIQSSSRDLQIIEDDAFSYEGYQVVRGEFFAHTYEPSFTFNANKVSVNTASFYGIRLPHGIRPMPLPVQSMLLLFLP